MGPLPMMPHAIGTKAVVPISSRRRGATGYFDWLTGEIHGCGIVGEYKSGMVS
jgi:hypothetical protein